jgi:integrase
MKKSRRLWRRSKSSTFHRRKQLRAYVLLLHYSGVRIQDVVRLTMDKISDGNLLMPTKDGASVWLRLPEIVLEALQGLGERPFWTGSGTIKTCMGNWQRTLERLFKRAGIKGSAHKFRHTFSVNLLTRGVAIEDVEPILANGGACENRTAQRPTRATRSQYRRAAWQT